MPITCLEDIERIEQTPIEERLPAPTLYDWFAATARRHEGKVAITALRPGRPLEPGRDVTFGQLLDDVNRAANLLMDLQVGPKDAVLDLLPLSVEGFCMKLAAETVGVAMPVNPMLEAEHLESLAREGGAKVIVAPGIDLNPEVFAKAVKLFETMPEITTVLVLGSAGEHACDRFLSLAEELARRPGDWIDGLDQGSLDDVVGYYHTGGTTGAPKLAIHTQRMRVVQAVSTGLMLDYGPEDTVMLGLPMFHIAGSVICGILPLLAGARLLLVDPRGYRSAEVVANFWRIVEAQKATVTICVPTTLAAVINVPVEGADLSSLRLFGCGGAPAPAEILRKASATIGRPVLEGFGMTELGSVTTFQLQDGPRTTGSVGLRAPYVRVEIREDLGGGATGGSLPVGETGVLCFKGPCVMPGYVGGRAQAETFTEDGWLVSGDLARVDASGEIWIVGRAKDMIIRGGHNIDPMVIEEALALHPSIELAAAVGRPDAYAGEIPVAYVQLKPGSSEDPEALARFARERISERAAAPADIVVLEKLPMTGFDKVFKPKLRADAAKRSLEAVLRSEDGLQAGFEVEVRPGKGGLSATIRVEGDEESAARASRLLSDLPLEIECIAETQPA